MALFLCEAKLLFKPRCFVKSNSFVLKNLFFCEANPRVKAPNSLTPNPEGAASNPVGVRGCYAAGTGTGTRAFTKTGKKQHLLMYILHFFFNTNQFFTVNRDLYRGNINTIIIRKR